MNGAAAGTPRRGLSADMHGLHVAWGGRGGRGTASRSARTSSIDIWIDNRTPERGPQMETKKGI